MAEAVGIAASVATLSKIVKYSTTGIQRFRDVPRELSDLSQEVAQLSIEVEILGELQNASLIPKDGMAMQIWTLQQASIVKAQTRIMAVQKALASIERKSAGAKGKIQWLVMNREETSSLLQNLLQVRMALTSIMSMSSSLLQLAFHAEEMRAIRDLTPRNERILRNEEQASAVMAHSLVPNVAGQNRLVKHNNIFQECNNAEFSLDIPLVGRVESTMTTLRHHTGIITYAISILLQLPFSRVFIADVFLRRWSFSWLNFRVLRDSTLAVVKLVEEDSCFMVACRRGDTDMMQKMLQQHQATPNEITLRHRTPMWEAIESGKTEAVELLLRYGSDINGLLGLRQTSPLVIAIRKRNVEMVRLLVAHGACDQHVTALGWTPLFYLWSISSSMLSESPADTLIGVLSSIQSFNLSHSEIIDTRGYGLIHMAAIRGTVADIRALIKCGVDPFHETGPAQWHAIHFAVSEGRLDIFEALLSYYTADDVNRTDGNGWTLLHITAISGHAHISKRLLELGADQQALTATHLSSAPDGLEHLETEIRGRRWTPLQLAALHSAHRAAVFSQIIVKFRQKHELHGVEASNINETDERWEDAVMYIS